MKQNITTNFINDVLLILEQARKKAYTAINTTMVEAYWSVGRRIVEEEQQGKERAEYGKEIINTLSDELFTTFGKGFSPRNLRNFRQFYLCFPDWKDLAHMCTKLTWSHIRHILRVSGKDAQLYYLKEASENNWSVRTLDRNISTLYYHRLASSQLKDPIKNEMLEKNASLQSSKFEFIKSPFVLEFLNLPANAGYTEASLEQALLDNLQRFLLELGKGFAFVARQKLVRTDTADFYIDLVFYNYLLKCFVIVELKTNKITHQDIGQLDMYVRMFNDLHRTENDNPTIGILLCTETDKTIAKYSVLSENKQLFATKYLPFLPTEEELIAEIEREKTVLKQQFDNDDIIIGQQ